MSSNTPLLPQHHGQRTDYGAATQQEQQQQPKRTASPSSDTVQGHAEAAKGKAKHAAHKAANAAQDARPDVEYALAALRAGKMPTTQQFVAWLHWLETSSLLQEGTYGSTGALSEEGARVVSDVRAVLEQLQSLAQDKNGDNAIQWFLYHTAHASLEAPTSEAESISSKAPSQRQAKRDGQKLLKALRQLGTLLVTDAAFNELQADLVLLARDLLADAAGTAADQVRGASDRLRPSDEQRQATGQDKRDRAIEMQGRDAEEIKQKGRDATDKVDKDKAKQAASQAKELGSQWLSDHTQWDSPEDARNEFVDRLKRVVVSVQSKGEYQEAVDVLLNVVRQYARTAKQLSKDVGGEAKSAAKNNSDDNLKLALSDLRNILEAFAGGFNLDELVQTVKKAFEDAKDERVGDYFSRLDRFIEKLLKEEGFVQTSAASRGMDKFYEEAQELLKSNTAWKEDADALQSQLQAYAHAVRTDEESRALLDALRTLADDLQSLAEQALNILGGQSKGLFRDLTDVWLPRAISAIQVIPMPRIEFKSADLDAIVDGITLEPAGASFIPDRIEIANSNVAQLFNGYAAFSTTFDSSTKLRIEGLRIKATDVAFYLHRKNAFFHKLDYGLLSIAATGDKGVCATVELEKAKDDDKEAYFFKVKHVSVEVDTLKVSVRKSHHPISNFFFASFAQPYLRTVICKLLEEKLGEGIGDLDEQLKLLSVRGTALTRYAVAAHTPGQRTPGSTGTPSVTGYLGALFGQTVSPFRSLLGGSSSRKGRFSSASTRNAIVKKGREGDWLLTIGAPLGQHIVNAQPGPPGWAQKHEEAMRAAQSKLDQLRHVGTMGKNELRKMGRDVERKADELRQDDDWRCDEAFDIPM